MELADLVGEHVLTGCDMGGEGAANAILFTLDGVTYRAEEDEDDGYRSSMRDIAVSEVPLKNTFEPVKVVGRMGSEEHYGRCDILQLIDAANGKVVLEVGTENTDDYYPSYVACFTPEAMSVNS